MKNVNSSSLTARARIRINSEPEAVFAAFAEAEQMRRFWFTRTDDGLKAGETCRWSLGSGDDAFSFEVRVIDVDPPRRIVIEWPGVDGSHTRVEWRIEQAEKGDSAGTVLTIEESGFSGSDADVVRRVLDSTGGFNQVIVAAKSLIEHGAAVNVVADHVQDG